MPFNSITFWVFFGSVLLLYQFLSHRLQNRMLLIASYIFYGYWDWRFTSLILLSTVVDYFIAWDIGTNESSRRRKFALICSIVVNLGVLGIFKYYGFFASEMNALLASIGLPASIPLLNLILPVGISFYTFQTMSYTIDVYRSVTKPTHDFLDFALYVSFFPQLVAGPIERSFRLLPQVQSPRKATASQFADGLREIVFGLFKKVVVADNMALIANTVFLADPSTLSGLECLVGIYAFAFQIYGDFSGYSSIAIGISKWLGFDLMTNFKTPYFAVSPSDFWRRWHVSLSTWLRDYLYIGMGGNRKGEVRTYRNLMLTMVLGGLWHGANWTYVAWGAFHGLLLCSFRALGIGGAGLSEHSVYSWVRRIAMFHLVCFGWLLFRAESLTQAWLIAGRIVMDPTATTFVWSCLWLILFYVGPLLAYELWDYYHPNGPQNGWVPTGLAYSYCVIMLIIFAPPSAREFIYFQF